jgi:long-chain acyl-CoA synthetase
VVRSTASWVDSFPHVARLTGLGAGDRVWVPGPSASTMNLFAAVLAQWSGAATVEEPAAATHAHLTPLHLVRALDAGVPLAGVHVTVAGDRLDEGLHDRATAAGARVSHYYGAAELSFVAWGPHAGALRPFPGVEVEPRPSAEGYDELWVRSAYLCSHYLGTGGPMRRDDRGFATVGDRGAVADDGVVRVGGRGGLAVTTGGATVHVDDVEQVLGQAVRSQVAVVAVPHGTFGEVVAAVLTDSDDHGPARAAARRDLEPAQRPRLWFEVEALPTTAAGKLDRVALVAAVAAGAARRLSGSRPAGVAR